MIPIRKYLFSREQIHLTLAKQCICYFESRLAAIPMADKLNKRVVVWDKYYYLMPANYNPLAEKDAGRPHAFFCYTPIACKEK